MNFSSVKGFLWYPKAQKLFEVWEKKRKIILPILKSWLSLHAICKKYQSMMLMNGFLANELSKK